MLPPPPLAQCYRQTELEKKRMYDERVREVERGTFSPLPGIFLLWWDWSSCNCCLQKTNDVDLREVWLGLSTLCFLIYLLFFLAILFYSSIIPKIIPKYCQKNCKNQINILLQLKI